MVIVFENRHGEYDFVIQTSVAFALAKLNYSQTVPDTRVLPFSTSLDLSAVTGLALVGHGKPGAIERWSAEQIGDALADNAHGVTSALKKLIVTSCYAGAQVGGKPGTSTVEVLASKLRHRGVGGLEIVGYNGPSIKNAELGFFAKVVNDPTPGATKDSTQLTQARSLQATAKTGHSFPASVNSTTNLGALGGPAAMATQNFYAQFIGALDKASLTLNGDDVARVCVVID